MTLSNHVKEFIEECIDLIESEDWVELFDYWYQTFPENMWWEDADYTEELMRVLDSIGVSQQETFEARKQLIEKYVESIVNDVQHKHYNRIDTWFIRWGEVSAALQSSLGFTTPELYDIFNDIEMAGITPEKGKQRYAVEGL